MVGHCGISHREQARTGSADANIRSDSAVAPTPMQDFAMGRTASTIIVYLAGSSLHNSAVSRPGHRGGREPAPAAELRLGCTKGKSLLIT